MLSCTVIMGRCSMHPYPGGTHDPSAWMDSISRNTASAVYDRRYFKYVTGVIYSCIVGNFVAVDHDHQGLVDQER